jgi:hypothetical protein
MALVSVFLEILKRPTIGDVMLELMILMLPIWIAVVAGILVGWAWKPKWANLKLDFLDFTSTAGEPNKSGIALPQFFPSVPSLSSLKLQVPTCISWTSDFRLEKENSTLHSASPDYSSSKLENGKSNLVNEDDLKHLHRLVEEKDGGPAWIQMMDRSTPNMSYQAWRRDPETGPPQYRSRTVLKMSLPKW